MLLAQCASIAHVVVSIMYGETIMYDAQRQVQRLGGTLLNFLSLQSNLESFRFIDSYVLNLNKKLLCPHHWCD